MGVEFFSPDYCTASERFRTVCASLGVVTDRYVNPAGLGSRGEELAIDVAWFGPRTAERVLLLSTGIHGLEGFCGSAIILQWLTRRQACLPPGQAVLIVHAANPWGFSHLSRTNENNVDLNRNFVDFKTAVLQPNPIYGLLHNALCPANWTASTIAAGRAALVDANNTYGVPAVTDALARGQYEIADGLFYGGRGPEWSNVTLRKVLADQLSPGRIVTAVDLHTGLGAYGQPFLLCCHLPESDAYERVVRAYGESVRDANKTYTGGRIPNFTGLWIDAIGQLGAHRTYCGLVIEFGTRRNDPHDQVKDALRLDRWLKFGQSDTPIDRPSLQAKVLEDYCPNTEEWRQSVLSYSDELIEKAITM